MSTVENFKALAQRGDGPGGAQIWVTFLIIYHFG